MPPQSGYSALAPQQGYAAPFDPLAGQQMTMSYLPSLPGQAPSGFDAVGKPLYQIVGAGPVPAGGFAVVPGFAEGQAASAASALAAIKAQEEQARLVLLQQHANQQAELHAAQERERQRAAYEEQMKQLAAAQQRLAYTQQEILANSVQAKHKKLDDAALPVYAAPGAVGGGAAGAYNCAVPGAFAGVGTVGTAGADPLSLVPAYGGQAPFGRTADGRTLYKTIPGPGF